MKKEVGDGINAANANWSFAGKTADTFEQHMAKSVPLYQEGHDLIVRLSDFFVKSDSVCYELGSSTGRLSHNLAVHNKEKGARFVGIELIDEMVKKSQETYRAPNLEFMCEDILAYDFKPSDFIVSYYTIQFVRPSQRQELFNKIYNSLKWGGAFILFEKVRSCDARFQDIMTNLYIDYKVSQGYSAEEIIGKWRSLKGVLEPFSTQGNIDLLKRAGFVDITSIMKYVCFEGFLAIK